MDHRTKQEMAQDRVVIKRHLRKLNIPFRNNLDSELLILLVKAVDPNFIIPERMS